MPNPQPSYILTRDTTCREGCPHYGCHEYPAHSHYTQKQPPAPTPDDREPNWIWRALFKLYGDGGR